VDIIDTAGVSLSPSSMHAQGPSEVYDPKVEWQPPGTEPGSGRLPTDATTPRDDVPMEIGFPPPNYLDHAGLNAVDRAPAGDTGGWDENLPRVFPGLSRGTPASHPDSWKAP
jgi:hypothetical protein